MDQGYKHFGHLHNLVMHQMPQGIEVSCSGCNSSGTGTVYVCWQCNFFLHEQCFKASRSLKHPSHPPHPLTLVPYPTYPSNSFYCNSCRIMGTGFSYSCADCEFDLHVKCAFSISTATSFQEAHQFQNLVPSAWNGVQNSIPFTPPHSISHVNYHSTPHAHKPIPIGYPSLAHPEHFDSISQNRRQDIAIVHFSHPHNLTPVDSKAEKGNDITCSGCKGTLIGKGYSCFEPNCNFHLHESCFHLKNQIQHKSHPEHLLNLLPSVSYNNNNNEYTCNACFNTGKGFTYHCSICNFDLHINCASLPATVKRTDHEHTLKLFYSCPVQGEECTVTCNVCHGAIQKDRWAYYCESCNNFDTHLDCVDSEKHEKYSVLDTQAELQRMKMEMEMAQQLAQMIAGMGASISNLAG